MKFRASLGNHDRPENVSYKLYNMDGQRYYTYTRNNVRFVVLDSTQLDAKQLQWLETTLRDAKEPWKICYFHHPLYSNAARHGSSVDLRVILEPIFVRYGVNVVFSGHDHVYERVKPQKGIYYFVSGSAGQLRKGNMRPDEDTAAYFDQDQSFMLVEVSDDDMFFSVISRTGRTVDSGVIHRSRWSRNVSSTKMSAACQRRGQEVHPMVNESARHRQRGWRRTVPRLSQFALEHLLLLPLGVAIALAWANLSAESYFRFSYAAAFAVNDVAMVFFFAVMTKEVVEATAPGGVLHSWRRVLMPVIASFGVALVPALIHLALVEPLDEPMLGVAWPVTLATDVAVCYLAARLIFGRWHAAIPFAILLAIASDAFGFVALALLSPNREPHWTAGLLILLFAMGVCDRVPSPASALVLAVSRSAPARWHGSPSTGAACIQRCRWS